MGHIVAQIELKLLIILQNAEITSLCHNMQFPPLSIIMGIIVLNII